MSTEPIVPPGGLGNLSKPANTLIKKVSAAIGGIFEPYQIKRIAKAETEADLIRAKSEVEITDLHRRAIHRWVEEEAQRQNNIEEITNKALPNLNDSSDPDHMEDDWITYFFDKARIVTDREMQQLWAQVLAGEANSPGTYSKRTVNFLSDLDKSEAFLFSQLCRYCWYIGEAVPLIINHEDEIYSVANINFNTLSHLESIGLVQLNSIHGFLKQSRKGTLGNVVVTYFGEKVVLEIEKKKLTQIKTGEVRLTKIGKELRAVCNCEPVDGFLEYVLEQWKEYSPRKMNI
ncbi:MAG: DUF2806 domain-containing protein [Gemmatimonadota bacterium]|nr:DUF2806 domain-containing protein [Gemmatimonadota bacterium]